MSDFTDADRKAIEEKILSASEQTYQRASWKHLYRWILFVFLAGLDIAMPMSLISRLAHHEIYKPLPELVQFVALFLINCWYMPVCLFEVNYAVIRGDELLIGNLIWSTKLKKGQVLSVSSPKFLACVLLRTPRCFYLINRSDIPNWEELLTTITERFV